MNIRNLLLLFTLLLSCTGILAQEVPDSSENKCYECIYEYRYSIDSRGKKDYFEEKELQILLLLQIRELSVRFEDVENIPYDVYGGKQITICQDDDVNDGFFSSDRTILFSADFGYLTFRGNVQDDVFILTQYRETYNWNEEDEELELLWDNEDNQDSDIGIWQYVLCIFLALLPAIALLVFILWRDRMRPEPTKELILACLLGLLSVPIAIKISSFGQTLGLYTDDRSSWVECLKVAFFGAAIPEELGKLIILWLLFKWRKHQNEFMDGIVYAACIGLAFATFENICYVLHSLNLQIFTGQPWALSTGITRALMSVPGHFGFAVMMGFFFSFYMFDKKRKVLFLALAYFVPVLFHGLYDSFAFLESISVVWASLMSFGFFLTFFVMNNLCVKAIRAALQLDNAAYSERVKIQSKGAEEQSQ